MWAVGLFYGINSVLNTVDFGFSVTHKGSQENTYIYILSVFKIVTIPIMLFPISSVRSTAFSGLLI